jgi:kynureninase
MSNSKPIDPREWREQFPISQKTVYMISNSLGAMPRSTRENLGRYADIWEERGVRSWAEGWWVKQDDLAQLLGPILGVKPSAVSMHQNVTVASAVFASALSFAAPRNKIVYTDMNFPTVMYLYDGIARQHGARVVRVESPDGIGVPTEKLLEAIDEETAVVPISHVLFRSSFIQDAQAIVEKARKVGAVVVLDVFQSVGSLPLELEKWGVHAAVGGALKWLCGGPGACFLYVSPELCNDLAPAFTGWMAHKRPFDFDPGPIDLREDGWRYLHGTPNVPGALRGRRRRPHLQFDWHGSHPCPLQEADCSADGQGPRARPRAYRARESRAARWHGRHPRPARLRGLPGAPPPRLRRRLPPKAGIRIAPHFYTLDEECVATIEEMRKILDTKAYEKHIGQEKLPG